MHCCYQASRDQTEFEPSQQLFVICLSLLRGVLAAAVTLRLLFWLLLKRPHHFETVTAHDDVIKQSNTLYLNVCVRECVCVCARVCMDVIYLHPRTCMVSHLPRRQDLAQALWHRERFQTPKRIGGLPEKKFHPKRLLLLPWMQYGASLSKGSHA